jgi:TRAP-type C4-dicarboxylate transport system substrate-binding protein
MKTSRSLKTMQHWLLQSGLVVSGVLAVSLVASCAPIQPPAAAVQPATITAAADATPAAAPLTLQFAVSDADGRPSAPYVNEFINQVKALSNGSMVLEPVWDAGNGTVDGFERGVIQEVRKGTYPLGLAASRTWDTQGLPNFQALQAPFLITNDALAEAVAAGDIGARMLASLPVTDVVGLTMWPEDLRHPFSVMAGKALLAPEDFKGLNIRSGPSNVTDMMLKTLGATPLFQDSGYQGAESGLRQGYTLMGKPTATANVTFYPKYQILFANGASFAQLSEEQRTILRQAAGAVQKKAIAEHPRDVDAGKAWCDDDGAIVLASDAQVAAFEQVEKPVFDKISEDPTNAELIAAVRELKAQTTPSPLAAACAPVTAAPTAAATSPVTLTMTDATMARLRLANWVYGTTATDMYIDAQGALLGSNQHPLTHVPVGFLTGFLYLEPGRHSVAVVPTGKGLNAAMIALDVDLEAGHRYTVGVMGQKEDDHFSPLVIDETAALAKAGDPSIQNMMIYVNNVAGRDTVDFLEDGVGPTNVPYEGFVAAPIKSGHVDHLVITANGGERVPDNPGDFYELPSGGFINANAGHYPSGPSEVYGGDPWSDLNAHDMLKQFSDVHVVWEDGVLSFNTFLAAVEKAGLNDLLTSGSYLIFAPTDAAFAAMPKEQLDALMADPTALADFVRYHIVQGYYPPGTLSRTMMAVADSTVTNLQGADLKLAGNLSVNDINMPGLPSLNVVDGTRVIPVTQVLAPVAP